MNHFLSRRVCLEVSDVWESKKYGGVAAKCYPIPSYIRGLFHLWAPPAVDGSATAATVFIYFDRGKCHSRVIDCSLNFSRFSKPVGRRKERKKLSSGHYFPFLFKATKTVQSARGPKTTSITLPDPDLLGCSGNWEGHNKSFFLSHRPRLSS